MRENAIGESEMIRTEDGREMRLSILRALESKNLMARKRSALKNMPKEKLADFYYKVYELISKHQFDDKLEPLFQLGLSPYTFMREPLKIGGFQTTYGELFQRLHQALNEAEMTTPIVRD